ncbi:XRE family transcriptional regulator [Paenimyroides tangerinum]|uniref:XRE family transcriptional regulator n=1 Tax=Paenimyroides tangerinum TaxID=2488728 RepID=A0A3P3W606_9FLAO|nr:helix-turn-helix transcriptional regulator [Paenimyroides tangerinum]RRJ89416.1 XRE family transcriptional regulator [Paenimyroides tangerinum]
MHKSFDEIERFIISKVKEIRESKGITQEQLSLALGKNISYVSQIEAQSKTAKYNISILNLLAIVLDCSPKDFWPEHPIKEEKHIEIKKIDN